MLHLVHVEENTESLELCYNASTLIEANGMPILHNFRWPGRCNRITWEQDPGTLGRMIHQAGHEAVQRIVAWNPKP